MAGRPIDLLKGITVSRLMNPVDANVYGNVHGGVILNLIEESGSIIASRYCNLVKDEQEKKDDDACFAAMARIEHMDFLLPMHIGEVAELMAEIKYTAPHSLLVMVTVWAENVLTGQKRLTNKAHLWYVPVGLKDHSKVKDVPPMVHTDPALEEKGKKAYDKQKADRMRNNSADQLVDFNMPTQRLGPMSPPGAFEPHTVEYSRSYLSMVIGVNECTLSGICRGGAILKLMDECAGIVAAKHARAPCVTASIEAINFHRRCPKGSLLSVFGYATFTSARSIEVEVIVECEYFRKQETLESHRERTADAFFTYVCIGKDGRTRPIAQLAVNSKEEEAAFSQGKDRYQKRKLERQASIEEMKKSGDAA